jgi:hypothetical protein
MPLVFPKTSSSMFAAVGSSGFLSVLQAPLSSFSSIPLAHLQQPPCWQPFFTNNSPSPSIAMDRRQNAETPSVSSGRARLPLAAGLDSPSGFGGLGLKSVDILFV